MPTSLLPSVTSSRLIWFSAINLRALLISSLGEIVTVLGERKSCTVTSKGFNPEAVTLMVISLSVMTPINSPLFTTGTLPIRSEERRVGKRRLSRTEHFQENTQQV